MSWFDLALHGVVALAAVMQAVTGIGFALIAGPVILIATDSSSALAVTAILCVSIAVFLVPSIWRTADWPIVRAFSLGSLAGLPLGAGLFAMADVASLKLGAALTLLVLLPAMLRGPRAAERRIGWHHGILPGILGGALAMPGPPAAMAMAATGAGKTATRSTILCFFAIVYPLVIFSQWAAGAVTAAALAQAMVSAAWLAPAAIFGTLLGRWLEPRVDERRFRHAVLAGIGGIAVSLVFDALRTLID